MSAGHSLSSTPTKAAVCMQGVPWQRPSNSLQVATGARVTVETCPWHRPWGRRRGATGDPCPPSPLNPPQGVSQVGLLHWPPRGGQALDRRQGAGITKELAPTTGSGSFLPQAASDWPGRGWGPGTGETVQAFVLRQVRPWACSRGAGGRQGTAAPSALARGRIQTLAGERLPAGCSLLLLQAPRRPRAPGPLGGAAEQSQGSPCVRQEKTRMSRALSRPCTTELRGRAPGGSVNSGREMARVLGVRGVLWRGRTGVSH